jgi:hypothetical protein
VLTEAFTNAFNNDAQKAEELIHALNGETQMSIAEILERAKNISTTFFEENQLDGLLA